MDNIKGEANVEPEKLLFRNLWEVLLGLYISARQYIIYRYTVAIASSADTILVQFPHVSPVEV